MINVYYYSANIPPPFAPRPGRAQDAGSTLSLERRTVFSGHEFAYTKALLEKVKRGGCMGYAGSSRGMGGFFLCFFTDCIYEPSDRIRHCGIAYEPWASSSRMGFGINLYCITYGQDMAATLRELFRYL